MWVKPVSKLTVTLVDLGERVTRRALAKFSPAEGARCRSCYIAGEDLIALATQVAEDDADLAAFLAGRDFIKLGGVTYRVTPDWPQGTLGYLVEEATPDAVA